MNRHAGAIIDQGIEFLNKIYYNLANFLEFDLVFKDFDYNFLLTQQEFYEAFEQFLLFEERFDSFQETLTITKENLDSPKVLSRLNSLQNDYQDKIKEYFILFELKTLRKLSPIIKYFTEGGLEGLYQGILSLQGLCHSNNNNTLLNTIKELYKRTHLLQKGVLAVEQGLDLLRKIDEPNKYEILGRKKLSKVIGLKEFGLKFQKMGFNDWIEFLQSLEGVLEEYLLKKTGGEMRELAKVLKRMSKGFNDLTQKEILKGLLGLIEGG